MIIVKVRGAAVMPGPHWLHVQHVMAAPLICYVSQPSAVHPGMCLQQSCYIGFWYDYCNSLKKRQHLLLLQ